MNVDRKHWLIGLLANRHIVSLAHFLKSNDSKLPHYVTQVTDHAIL